METLAAEVIGIIAKTAKLPQQSISVDSTFEELGLDSLDGIQIAMALEEKYRIDIPDDTVRQIRSVRQIVEQIPVAVGSANNGWNSSPR